MHVFIIFIKTEFLVEIKNEVREREEREREREEKLLEKSDTKTSREKSY